LRRGSSIALVTGDPPPVPHLLSHALRKGTQSRRAVVDIACHAELTSEELYRARSVVAALPASGGPAVELEPPASAPPIFVLADADQLSDQRIREIVELTERDNRRDVAAVLLARSGFLSRLEEPPLQFLKEQLAARFEFQDIGPDEGIAFLRYQLAARHALSEARRMPSGVLRGLAASGVLVIASIGVFLLFQNYHLAERSLARPDVPEAVATPSEVPLGAPRPAVPDQRATAAASQPAPPSHATPSRDALSPPGAQAILPAPEPASTPEISADQRPLPAEIEALVARGDNFLNAGDIISARLFYERAADAGNASAALRLGATFDEGFLNRAGIRGTSGEPRQAASWYRRARDLGDAAAAERLKNLDAQRSGEPSPSPR
jgi:hypothetical protein